MANSYKYTEIEEPEKEPKAKSGKGLFSMFETVLTPLGLFKNGFPVKYVPYVFFCILLLIAYIWNGHTRNKLVRNIEKLKIEVNDLRADYTTLKAELMYKTKQSEVAKEVLNIGLEESIVPPQKINTKDIEY
jgi:hypothetical protein